MRRWIIICVLALAAALSFHGACAQQGSTLEPILRATIDPPRVVVGQQATLRIEVLAPNYMTAPPGLPDFQVRNAVTRQLQTVNMNEQHDGVTYAGLRLEFALYPQEPGSYAIAGQKILVRYAAEPPATRSAELALPRIQFGAFIPDDAAALRPFVAATRLTVEQTVKRSSDTLKTGDAVTRTITIKAEDTPAMLLPPQAFAALDGLALYPAQPSLDDRADGRTGTLTATRTDSAAYMLQRPGDYTLPAIDVSWWNVGAQKVERTRLEPVVLHVAANPDMAAATSAERSVRPNWDVVVDFLSEHWLLATIALLTLAALAWIAPRAIRAMIAHCRQRHAAWLQSEAYSFRQFRRAAMCRDAQAVYFALLNWLQLLKTFAPVDSVETLKAVVQDPILNFQIEAIEQELFARDARAIGWSPRQLQRRVGVARRALLRWARRGEAKRPLPQRINPIGDRAGAGRQRRLPAHF
jgi:hypothetical protein